MLLIAYKHLKYCFIFSFIDMMIFVLFFLFEEYFVFPVCENIINHSVVALLGLFNGDTYSVMESYSRTLKLPFLLPTLTRGTADPRNNYMISMWPSFVDVVVDFIKYFQWTRFVYLYDTEDGKCFYAPETSICNLIRF